MAPKDDYFKLPGAIWIVLVPLGLALLSLAAVSPDSLPYDYMGPIGTLTKYLVEHRPTLLKFTFYLAWALHVYEADVARRACESKNLSTSATIKWTIQTFIYGYFSLSTLLLYEPVKKNK